MLYILSFGLWLLFNGRVTPEIVLFGVGISVLSSLCCRYLLGWSREKDRALARELMGIVKLLALLLKEIFKADLAVIGWVYGRKEPESVYVTMRPELKRKGFRIALADCITLTPGTITGTLDKGEYTVHCLDSSMGEGIESSAFVTLLRKLEEKP